MFNLRKTLALVVVFVMALGVGATAATFPDVSDDATYAEAVTILNSLKIFEGDDQGNFRPDDTITRAEVVAVVLRAQGSGDAAAGAKGNTVFSDVGADHWAAGYINIATQLGIVNGFPDKTFKPGDPVTYEQATKMIVAALGYGPKAEMQGGYPGGYLIIASQERIATGAAGKAGEPAKRSIVARLVFNALEVKMLEQTGFNPAAPEYKISDKTLLYDSLKVAKIDGIVIETDITRAASNAASFSTDSEVTLDILSINGLNKNSYAYEDEGYSYQTYTVKSGNINADGYLGYRVVAYIADFEDSVDEQLVAIAPKSGVNNELVVSYSQIEKYDTLNSIGSIDSKPTLKYRAKISDRNLINIPLSAYAYGTSDAVFYFNGVEISIGEFSDYIDDVVAGDVESGKLVFVDNNNDGKYDYVSVTKVNHDFVVYSVNEADLEVSDKNSNVLYFDNLEDDSWTILYYNADGTPASFKDIKKGDVLSIARSDNDDDADDECYLWQVYIAGEAVEGKITERTQDSFGKYLYRIGDGYYRSAITVNIEDEGTFYINYDGKIVYKDAESVKSGNYAFLQKVGTTRTGVDGDVVQFRYLTSSNKWETRNLAKRVSFVKGSERNNVDSYTKTPGENFTDDVFGLYDLVKVGENVSVTVGENTNTLFKFSTNAAGEISRVEVATSGYGTFSLDDFGTESYRAATNMLGIISSIRNDIIVFNVPLELYDASNNDLDVKSFTVSSPNFSDGEIYTYKAYDDEGGYPRVMVVYGRADKPANDSRIVVVKEIKERYDSQYGEYYHLVGMQAGKEVEADADEDCPLDGLKEGDAIIVATDAGGRIINYELLFSASDVLYELGENNEKWDAAKGTERVEDITEAFGFLVNQRENSVFFLSKDYESKFDTSVDTFSFSLPKNTSVFTVYEVDTTRNNNKVRTISTPKVTLAEGKTGSYLYVRMYKGNVIDIVSYLVNNPTVQ